MNKTQIKLLLNLAIESGKIASKFFQKNNLNIQKKSDNSPVTDADKEISQLICTSLEENFPGTSIISEEEGNRKVNSNKFWLIDPIDGTKNFIRGENEFTVNIALIENNIAKFGLIYCPEMPDAPIYYTDEEGKNNIHFVKKNQTILVENKKEKTDSEFRVITSNRCKNEDILDFISKNFSQIDVNKVKIVKKSSSFKFCQIIDDKADLFINLEPTMEWDTAAGNALILAQNGRVLDKNLNNLTYNKEKFLNQGFIAGFTS